MTQALTNTAIHMTHMTMLQVFLSFALSDAMNRYITRSSSDPNRRVGLDNYEDPPLNHPLDVLLSVEGPFLLAAWAFRSPLGRRSEKVWDCRDRQFLPYAATLQLGLEIPKVG